MESRNWTHVYRIEPVGDPAVYAFRIDQETDDGEFFPCIRPGLNVLFSDSPAALAAIEKLAPDARRVNLPHGAPMVYTPEAWLFRIVVFSLKRFPITEHVVQQRSLDGKWWTVAVAEGLVVWTDYDAASSATRSHAESQGMGSNWNMDIPLRLGLPVSMTVEDWVNKNQPEGTPVFSRFVQVHTRVVQTPLEHPGDPGRRRVEDHFKLPAFLANESDQTIAALLEGSFRITPLTNGLFHIVRYDAVGKFWKATNHPTTVGYPFHQTPEQAEQAILAYGRAMGITVTLIRNSGELVSASPGCMQFPRSEEADPSGGVSEARAGGLCENGHDFRCDRCGTSLRDHVTHPATRVDNARHVLERMREDKHLNLTQSARNILGEAIFALDGCGHAGFGDRVEDNRYTDGRHAIVKAVRTLEALDWYLTQYGEGPNAGEALGNQIDRVDTLMWLYKHPQYVAEQGIPQAEAIPKIEEVFGMPTKPLDERDDPIDEGDLSLGSFGRPTIDPDTGMITGVAPSYPAQVVPFVLPEGQNYPPADKVASCFRIRPNFKDRAGWYIHQWDQTKTRWDDSAVFPRTIPAFTDYWRAIDALYGWSRETGETVNLVQPTEMDVMRWANHGFTIGNPSDDPADPQGLPSVASMVTVQIDMRVIKVSNSTYGNIYAVEYFEPPVSEWKRLGTLDNDGGSGKVVDWAFTEGKTREIGRDWARGRGLTPNWVDLRHATITKSIATYKARVVILPVSPGVPQATVPFVQLYGVQVQPIGNDPVADAWTPVASDGMTAANDIRVARDIGDGWAAANGQTLYWVTDDPGSISTRATASAGGINTLDVRVVARPHADFNRVYEAHYRESVVGPWHVIALPPTMMVTGQTAIWVTSIIKAQQVVDRFLQIRARGEVPVYIEWPEDPAPAAAPAVEAFDLDPVKVGTRIAMLTNADGFYSVLEWATVTPNLWTVIAEELPWEDAEALLTPIKVDGSPAIGTCEIRPSIKPGDSYDVHIWEGTKWRQIAGDVTRRTAEGVVKARANDPEMKPVVKPVTMTRVPVHVLEGNVRTIMSAKSSFEAIKKIIDERSDNPGNSFADMKMIEQIVKAAIAAIDKS